ncbi:MAG: exodeoxyribonuclease subunit gamma [Actinomycetota bacterium]
MGVDVRGGLQVSFVENLDGIIKPVVDYLNTAPAGRDLFDVDHIIVPNAGVRAWLLQQIANKVGVTPGKNDGIAAQVNIKYLGALDGFLGRGFADSDPWEVGPLSISVLNVLQSVTDANILANVKRLGGGLKAARAIADKFDQYHARRPSMILEWINSGPNLAPTLADDFRDGQYIAQRLADSDKWQYDLWKLVHASIGQDPWAAVVQGYLEKPDSFNVSSLPPRLLVAGVQSLSARHIRVLQLLAQHIEVSVYMVHPSPALAKKWQVPAVGNVPTQIIAPLTPARVEFDESVDPLVGMWLRGAHDAQQLLASQGESAKLVGDAQAVPVKDLLSALQQSVRTGKAQEHTFVGTDRSVQMHRAHNLGRQIEIVHEALIHAFNDVDGLEPHDVVIICADVEAAAPLLEATFSRRVKSKNGNYRLPLVVADRGLRFVDDGASLLASILTAARGRFSISEVMAVATSPLVLQNFGANGDDVETWNRIIERTRIRWGANRHHRTRMNVDIHEDSHTWSAGLQRALTGALLPDGPIQNDFGDVVPLADVEAADIDTVATLSHIVSVLSELEKLKNSHTSLSIIEWSDAVDEALTSLGIDSRGQLDNAREVINKLRGYVSTAAGEGVNVVGCTFEDFADLLEELIAGTPGRQPLRTGAITATSMVPLRSVPFKVVCLVGFDEGTMRAGEAEGDDLVSRQDFVGDSNARIDQRRAILDAIVAATDQVIITCNGRSIKDNTEVPLITPLSELLDLCERCGVPKRDKEGNHLKIEYQHPRHFSSERNYVEAEILDGLVWSHDEVGLAALSSTKSRTEAQIRADEVSEKLKRNSSAASDELIISPKDFLRFVDDPLKTFVQFGLKISTWSDESEDDPALVPLTSRKDELTALCRSYIDDLYNKSDFDSWKKKQTLIGSLPFGKYGDDQAEKVKKLGDKYMERRGHWGIDHTLSTVLIDVPFKGGRVKGEVEVFLTNDNCIALHEYQVGMFTAPSQEHMAHLLLLLLASGQHFDGGHILFRRKKQGDTYLNHVELAESVSASDAVEKVRALAGLMQLALLRPYPLFGDTAKFVVEKDQLKALKAFRGRVASRRSNEDGDEFSYIRTREGLVYGAVPVFDDVYTKDVVPFFEQYFVALLGRDKTFPGEGEELKRKPPHGGKKDNQRYVYA